MNEEHADSATPTAPHALFVECSRKDGVVVAKLVGPSIGQREAPIIAKAVVAEIQQGAPPHAAVLDFRRVSFLNSVGLGMCVEIRNVMHQLGGKTILYRVTEQVASVMKMTKMDRLYTIVGDREELKRVLQR